MCNQLKKPSHVDTLYPPGRTYVVCAGTGAADVVVVLVVLVLIVFVSDVVDEHFVVLVVNFALVVVALVSSNDIVDSTNDDVVVDVVFETRLLDEEEGLGTIVALCVVFGAVVVAAMIVVGLDVLTDVVDVASGEVAEVVGPSVAVTFVEGVIELLLV